MIYDKNVWLDVFILAELLRSFFRLIYVFFFATVKLNNSSTVKPP